MRAQQKRQSRQLRQAAQSVVKAWLKFSWLLMSWFYNALWLREVTSCPGTHQLSVNWRRHSSGPRQAAQPLDQGWYAGGVGSRQAFKWATARKLRRSDRAEFRSALRI